MPSVSSFFGYKPDSKKNCFQNYNSHVNRLVHNALDIRRNFSNAKNKEKWDIFEKETLARLNMFEPLRDGHDYTDEFLGASVVPFIAGAFGMGALGQAIWDSIKGLAIKCNLMQDDREAHFSKAGQHLLLAGAAILFAVAAFVKSVISIFTRPVVTAIYGYKAQNEVRFQDEAPTL